MVKSDLYGVLSRRLRNGPDKGRVSGLWNLGMLRESLGPYQPGQVLETHRKESSVAPEEVQESWLQKAEVVRGAWVCVVG